MCYLFGDKYLNVDYCDCEMKGWCLGGFDGWSEVEFFMWWCGKDGCYCCFCVLFICCFGLIFYVEIFLNIFKFFVIIFVCNLYCDV